jgi:phosphoribosylglycinamide formyltransferase-1
VDSGPIIGSIDVPIYPNDSEETLAQRMHQAEHTLLVQSLLRLVEGDEDLDDEEWDEEDEG